MANLSLIVSLARVFHVLKLNACKTDNLIKI